jgi:hypothetical protein
VIDGDGQEAVDWVEGKPLPDDMPTEGTRHGFHLWLSIPKCIRIKSIVTPAPKVDLLGPGHLVYVAPSPGKQWKVHLRSELPAAPEWLIEVATAKAAPSAHPTKPLPEVRVDELDEYRKLLPDLKWDGATGRACCPLHDDVTPSLGLYRRRTTGQIDWRCAAQCEASAQTRGQSRHGGNVRDLGRLIRISYSRTEPYERLGATAQLLPLSEQARALLTAIINRGREHHLDLADPTGIGFDFRSMARATGLDRVTGITPERPAGWLSNNGDLIRKAIGELERFGLKVIRGTSHRDGQRGRRTAFVVPAIWYAPASTRTRSAAPEDVAAAPDETSRGECLVGRILLSVELSNEPEDVAGPLDPLLSAVPAVTCEPVRQRPHVTGPFTCDWAGRSHVTGPSRSRDGGEEEAAGATLPYREAIRPPWMSEEEFSRATFRKAAVR